MLPSTLVLRGLFLLCNLCLFSGGKAIHQNNFASWFPPEMQDVQRISISENSSRLQNSQEKGELFYSFFSRTGALPTVRELDIPQWKKKWVSDILSHYLSCNMSQLPADVFVEYVSISGQIALFERGKLRECMQRGNYLLKLHMLKFQMNFQKACVSEASEGTVSNTAFWYFPRSLLVFGPISTWLLSRP